MPVAVAGKNNLFADTISKLQTELAPKPHVADQRAKARVQAKTGKGISLANFVEATSNLIMEPWQVHLCQRLEKLKYQTGQRILIHKPPQHGGSVIVSQRLPSYLIGYDPAHRVKVACYNIEHAKKFTAINKRIMQSSEYRAIFAQNANLLNIPSRASEAEFSTYARSQHKDAQASLMALGLLTGFVGQGADTLVIDDPYASPQDAKSPAILKSVWTFWEESASVRIDEETNVVVMFHRYHEDDFVGQLIKEEGLKNEDGTGVWELISYRAEWDGDERPEIGGKDPMSRKKGEYLSPRKARQVGYYERKKSKPYVWLSQFQGKPSRADGTMFNVKKFEVIDRVPCRLLKVCRAWDIASSQDGDWSVGVLMGLGEDEYIYVLDVIYVRENTDKRNTVIKRTANMDRIKYREHKLVTVLPQDPSGAGKDQGLAFKKLLKGHTVKIVNSFNRGNKESRADPWSGYVNAGLVKLVYSGDMNLKDAEGERICWIQRFVERHQKFPASSQDDEIDASADCFSEVALELDIEEGEDFDTLGLRRPYEKSLEQQYFEENPADSEGAMLEDYLAMRDEMSANIGDELRGNSYGNSSTQNSQTNPRSVYRGKTGPDGLKFETLAQRKAARKTKAWNYKHNTANQRR